MGLDLPRALDIARKAAEAGAAIAMDRRASGRRLQVKAKAAADFVTDVDRQSQEAIVRALHAAFPVHRILAEEEGADAIGDPACPYRWVIDPLDGTTPFIHGKEDFGTIIALQESGDTILGVMVLPAIGERFFGTRGGGAFFNGDRITGLRHTKDMNDAILCTNTIQDRLPTPMVTAHFPRCASLQNYGCAAEELGDILKGQNDGAFFNGPHLWDVAAGCLLIEEAGGRAAIRLKDEKNPRGSIVAVASTQPIFEELHRVVFGDH